MNGSPNALRPEAGPVPFEYLNRSQTRAMEAIALALKEAVAQASDSDRLNQHDVMIDSNRISRLFFVSGQPGSGKSSLYLTLRAILDKNERFNKYSAEYEARIPDLLGLRGATIWLEQIDLEVAGDMGENLLAAVLVRIFAALDDSSGLPSKTCQEAMNQINDLANDIGIAWDGNLLARAPALDPQSYSQEVMNAQRARLGTNKRLSQALKSLLTHKCYGCNGENLFILPIDDFYLKPAASLELLRLLRMISVPNLFLLIMGDIKTMEALFFEKALADWTAVAGPRVFASLDDQKQNEILSRVREMRARYLRKLLPTGQRAIIEWTSWDEALCYRPTVIGSSAEASRLSTLLRRVCIESKEDTSHLPSNLLDCLVSPVYVESTTKGNDQGPEEDKLGASKQGTSNKSTLSRVKSFREGYSALLVLDATPREVVDLWMRLAALQQPEEEGTDATPAYLWTVVDFVLVAIEEQDFLTEQQQDSIRYAFPTSHRDDLLIETSNFDLVPKCSPRVLADDEKVFVHRHLDWKLGVANDDSTHSANTPKYLPPRPAAWIILMHDLAWNWRHRSLTYNLVTELLEKVQRADNVIRKKGKWPTPGISGWAWYMHERRWKHFPLPAFTLFRQLDRFLSIWNDGLSEESEALPLNRIIDLWGRAAWIATSSEKVYENFVRKANGSEEDKVEFERFRATLFEKHNYLISRGNVGK